MMAVNGWLLVLWAAWIIQCGVAVLLARKLSKRLGGKPRAREAGYRPRAFVIVPFKGFDTGLDSAVGRLFEQDYPDYELLFVVESKDDSAYPVLAAHLARTQRVRAEVVLAGRAGPGQGQKVHNQMTALRQIDPCSRDQDVWVFADSDAVPGPSWLGAMVGPLVKSRLTGATTGYRWLVPAGAKTFWSSCASVLNSSSAVFLASRRLTCAWGGSMAMRVATARRGDLMGRLRGALTDDFPVTRMCRQLKLRVYFVASCLLPTPVTMGLGDLVNFIHRQFLITRVYAPGLFWSALAVVSLFMAGWLSAASHVLVESWQRPGRFQWCWSLGVCLVAGLMYELRWIYRRRIVRQAFAPPVCDQLRQALWCQMSCV